MKYSYYPGCTREIKPETWDAYRQSLRRGFWFLGMKRSRTGSAVAVFFRWEAMRLLPKLASVRALQAAKEKGQDLITVCSACHHVLKRVNDDMKHVEDIRTRANII